MQRRSSGPQRPAAARARIRPGPRSPGHRRRTLVVRLEAVGGLAAQPGCVSVIAGSMSAEQVKANAQAGTWIPTADQLAAIDEVVPPPVAGG